MVPDVTRTRTMQDIPLMTETFRMIAEHGTRYEKGVAAEKVISSHGYEWYVGNHQLNGHIVERLINAGWLKLFFAGTAAMIVPDARPAFCFDGGWTFHLFREDARA